MPLPVIVLRAGRERSLARRHPWIFSGGVTAVQGSPGPGDTVEVHSATGDRLGLGAFSPESQIRVRMWTFAAGVGTGTGTDIGTGTSATVDAAFVADRIARAQRRRAALLASGTDAARLVFSEADGVPGLIADRYGDTVVCQFTTAGADRWRDVIADALFALDGVRSVYERSDADVRQREGLEPVVGRLRGDEPPGDLTIHEGRWRYAIDVAGGHKTGFYLDQRNARREIESLAADARVLNVCSYTGAFSVIAAGSGAASVLSIDSSGPALAAAERNAVLNDVVVGELMEADAFTALRGLRDRARQFDLIALDPPKLANTDQQVDKAARAYKDLNLLAIKLLAPGGRLLTFSCSAAMVAELFQKVVAGAALDAGRTVRIIGRLAQPSDHPVPLNFPEAEYLKGLILQAE